MYKDRTLPLKYNMFHMQSNRPTQNILAKLSEGVDGGSPCRMSIIRNGNVALSNLRNTPVAMSNLRNIPVALSNLRNTPVACH